MPKGMEDNEENAIFKRALVWTIWNKTDRKVYVISEGYKEAPLVVKDDPLRLEQFFPVPRPLYSIFTTDSLIPVPEYAVYQDHAIQLDEINERIAVLTDALRRRGVYDASIEELAGPGQPGRQQVRRGQGLPRLHGEGRAASCSRSRTSACSPRCCAS
jgi:hypothetical protein